VYITVGELDKPIATSMHCRPGNVHDERKISRRRRVTI
jgi:hypothetical protein